MTPYAFGTPGSIDPIPEAQEVRPDVESPVEDQQEQANVITLSREAMLEELHAWCKSFVRSSSEWRKTSYETNWARWQRDADAHYDPELAKKKEPWQSKAVWPLTAAHRENAQAVLFKTELGAHPAIQVKARDGIVGQEGDQSDNIRDLVLREREKSHYEVGRNSCLYDKTTFGSGFMQIYFDTVIEDRVIQDPQYEPLQAPSVDGGASIQRSLQGQRQIIGYKPTVKPQVIYRGVRARHISIWDVFPDPKALDIPGSPIAIRYNTTYQDLLEGAKPTPDGKEGYVLPEALEKLRNVSSFETDASDRQLVNADRGIASSQVKRPEYGKRLECYEIQARLPKKWVLLDGQDIDDPEALIPARVRYHQESMVSVGLNESYDGEPDIYKDDYFPIAGQFYGLGIPEMCKDPQAVASETVNQRLDSGAISLKKVFAVIEKSVVDPKDFNNWANGSTLRLKAKDGMTNIDQLFREVEMTPPERTSFIEPQEWERAAHERTSITQTTLGSEDNKDTTLGAQQIQQGVTGGKMAYLQMISEFGFQRQIFKAYWKNIYMNYQPQDYAMALGQERAKTIVPMNPEQLENNYQYFPLGVMEQQGKASRQQQLAMWDQQFGMMPWVNRLELAKEELRSMDQESDKFIVKDADAQQITMKAQEMAQGMAQQMAPQMAQQMMQEKAHELGVESGLKSKMDKKMEAMDPKGKDE